MYDDYPIIATCRCGKEHRGHQESHFEYECGCGKTVSSSMPLVHIVFIMISCVLASYFYLIVEKPNLYIWWKPLALGIATGACLSFLFCKIKVAFYGHYIYRKSSIWAFLCSTTGAIFSFIANVLDWLVKIALSLVALGLILGLIHWIINAQP